MTRPPETGIRPRPPTPDREDGRAVARTNRMIRQATETEVLRHVRDGRVHRSSDLRAWLRLPPGSVTEITAHVDRLYERGYIRFQRNAGGWYALARLCEPGEQMVGRGPRMAGDLTDEDAKLIVDLYASGERLREIARVLRIGENRVRDVLIVAGVRVRTPGRPSEREATS